MDKILLCSTSEIKTATLKAVLEELRSENSAIPAYEIVQVNCDDLGLPPQPVNCGPECCIARIMHARKKCVDDWKSYAMIVAIENAIQKQGSKATDLALDVCYVRILIPAAMEFVSLFAHERPLRSRDPVFSVRPYIHFVDGTEVRFSNLIKGYGKTVGEALVERGMATNSKNWMAELYNCSRNEQISSILKPTLWKAITVLQNQSFDAPVMVKAGLHPDFPKKGVTFIDFFSVMNQHMVLPRLLGKIAAYYERCSIDAVVGLESRGFIVGALIADRLHVPFIPIRKPGKLPGSVIGIEYQTEYSTDQIQIQVRDFKGLNVIIADDFVATGGTFRAALDLMTLVGATVYDLFAFFEDPSLRETAKATIGRPYSIFFKAEAN